MNDATNKSLFDAARWAVLPLMAFGLILTGCDSSCGNATVQSTLSGHE